MKCSLIKKNSCLFFHSENFCKRDGIEDEIKIIIENLIIDEQIYHFYFTTIDDFTKICYDCILQIKKKYKYIQTYSISTFGFFFNLIYGNEFNDYSFDKALEYVEIFDYIYAPSDYRYYQFLLKFGYVVMFGNKEDYSGYAKEYLNSMQMDVIDLSNIN